ncbi:TPA: lysine transporter LysE [Candidatus Dependentiae bacterium]|nr:MAG: hypothetical protein UW09_C0002G0025 [candidate division TM6 bacterium GW2011_GWF2_43_87]HBL98106.1 lysine transporter LysE [Candidatus Dependentiae bacterium]
MLLLPLFLKALVLGFAVAVPIGPVGIVCIRATLSYGLLGGLMTGLGAATADVVYALVASFGFAAASGFLEGYKAIFALLGGIFLVYLGFSFLRKPPLLESSGEARATSYFSMYLSTFGLTFANPMTLFTFVGILSVLKVFSGGVASRLAVVAGVFSGALLWWMLLSFVVYSFKGKMSARFVLGANAVAGVLVVGFGAYVVARSALMFLLHTNPLFFMRFIRD